jgi:hypothetical protein
MAYGQRFCSPSPKVSHMISTIGASWGTDFRSPLPRISKPLWIFFYSGVHPHNPFPLDRQSICTTNKFGSQVNHDLQQWRSQKTRLLAVIPAFTLFTQPLPNCPGFSESHQLDVIEKIDTPDLPPNKIYIFGVDPFILLRNIDTRSGLAKGGRCRASQVLNRTVVLHFDDGQTRVLTRIPMEQTSNGMTFREWQPPLKLLFAGTVYRSQGMTLQRAVIDCRTKFWEHGQFYVILSRVKNPADLYILLPPDMDDFTIGPPVDLDVFQILETINTFSEAQIAASCLANQMYPFPPVFDCPDRALLKGLPCPGDHFDSEDQLDSVSEFEDDDAEIVTLGPAEIPINAAVMTGIFKDQQVFRFSCLGSDR